MANDKNSSEKQLLIIGNGFDLYCGLKSTFNDYFSYLDDQKESYKELKSFLDEANHTVTSNKNTLGIIILEHVCNKFKENNDHPRNFDRYINKFNTELNFWDCYFYMNKPPKNDWYDVESLIHDFFSKKNSNYSILKTYLNELKQFVYGSPSIPELVGANYSITVRECAFLLTYQFGYFESNLSLVDFLLNELKKFEEKFGKYIKKISEREAYTKRVKPAILNLTPDINTTDILSFNYTNMALSPSILVRNVHSTVDNDPIIGIDSSNINADKEDYYCFTKTYRTMRLAVKEKQKHILNKNITNVIFFGHSLSKADYAYFQAIFDYLDIYSRPVTLTFCYCAHGSTNSSKAARDQYDSISKLMLEYGNTIPNHGKNLLHKLLLEDRLIMREIDNK